jgi:superfamily II DNA or RNA helicase
VRALQQGIDVVVQAPTGSGKTYIFELLYPNLKTQAVFTVPTRAAPTRVHALPPRLPWSPVTYHKRLTMD